LPPIIRSVPTGPKLECTHLSGKVQSPQLRAHPQGELRQGYTFFMWHFVLNGPVGPATGRGTDRKAAARLRPNAPATRNRFSCLRSEGDPHVKEAVSRLRRVSLNSLQNDDRERR
jgi:hypothetical protein